jgi:hypothetical protein
MVGRGKGRSIIASAVAVGFLGGCGLYVPALSEIYDGQDTQTMVNAVVEHVQCEVQTSVQFLLLDDIDAAAAASAAGLKQGRSVEWVNTPPPKGGGFRLRLEAGLIDPSGRFSQTTLKLSSGSSGF